MVATVFDCFSAYPRLAMCVYFSAAFFIGMGGWYCLRRFCQRAQCIGLGIWRTVFLGLAFVFMVGVTANVLVVWANGGRMPVATLWLNGGEPTRQAVREYEAENVNHTLLRHGTRLAFLADIYTAYLAKNYVKYFSLGDALMFLSTLLVGIWLMFLMLVRN